MTDSKSVIYCDEAGYTGNDLLNVEQKYFVLGSTDIAESHAKELVDEAIKRFRLQRDSELKGANLIRHGTGRMALKWLMNECRGHFHVVYYEKLYAISAKFFEAFFEPLLVVSNLLCKWSVVVFDFVSISKSI